jgi:hypothetical protein
MRAFCDIVGKMHVGGVRGAGREDRQPTHCVMDDARQRWPEARGVIHTKCLWLMGIEDWMKPRRHAWKVMDRTHCYRI